MKKVQVLLKRSGQRITILTESPAGELVDLTLMQEAIVQLYQDKERLIDTLKFTRDRLQNRGMATDEIDKLLKKEE